MQVYIDQSSESQGDLYSYSMTIHRDDAGAFWLTGDGGAGSIFAKSDRGGGSRYGSIRHRIGVGVWDLSTVNQTYNLGLELPQRYWRDGERALYDAWIAAKLPIGQQLS